MSHGRKVSVLKLSQLIGVRPKQLGPLDVVTNVNLLILRVGPVIRGSHGQEDHILPGGLLQGQSDGDAAPLPGQVGLHAVHHLGGPETLASQIQPGKHVEVEEEGCPSSDT